ncbi:metal-sensitive transcriptional regulator [Streptomyces chattanoogensis]|uniref:metal-sensitive transcriptional regulator n=1 Tax=Streptomyces chattanoogensis TaxID=66876 RepID=UPI0005D75A28|nr:Copper-sensing transcriptional repressor RicR [Streptomyces lydicus]
MTTTDADTSGTAAAAAADHTAQPKTDPGTVTDSTAPSPSAGVHGYAKQKDAHIKRLRRIEGQIRGLQRMLEEDVYCIDILTQVSASTKGLQSFGLQLLEEHLRHCVADAAAKGPEAVDAKVQEATKAIERMLRT